MVFLIKIIYEVSVLRDALQMNRCKFPPSIFFLFQKLMHIYESEMDQEEEKKRSRSSVDLERTIFVQSTRLVLLLMSSAFN